MAGLAFCSATKPPAAWTASPRQRSFRPSISCHEGGPPSSLPTGSRPQPSVIRSAALKFPSLATACVQSCHVMCKVALASTCQLCPPSAHHGDALAQQDGITSHADRQACCTCPTAAAAHGIWQPRLRHHAALPQTGSHVLSQHSLQIVVLEKGQVVEAGSHSQLVQKGGLYSRMWAQTSVDDSHSLQEEGQLEGETVAVTTQQG